MPNLNELKVAIEDLKYVSENGGVWCGNYDRAFKNAISTMQSVIDGKLVEPMGREEIIKHIIDVVAKRVKGVELSTETTFHGNCKEIIRDLADAIVGGVGSPKLTEEGLAHIINLKVKELTIKKKYFDLSAQRELAKEILKGLL